MTFQLEWTQAEAQQFPKVILLAAPSDDLANILPFGDHLPIRFKIPNVRMVFVPKRRHRTNRLSAVDGVRGAVFSKVIKLWAPPSTSTSTSAMCSDQSRPGWRSRDCVVELREAFYRINVQGHCDVCRHCCQRLGDV